MSANPVGLFVDYENIYISIVNQEPRSIRHEVLAHRLLDIARAYGDLAYLVVWADWDRFPGAQRVFATLRYDTRFVPTSAAGKNSADMAMQAEILKLLNTENALSSFLIATGDRDFIFTVDELKRNSRQIILIGVEGTTSLDLRRAVHEFVPLYYSTGTVEDPYAASEGASAAGGDEATGAEVRVPVEVLEQIRGALVGLLAERHLPWISYRLFANHLITLDIAAPEVVHRWIEKAVEEGFIVKEEERGAVKRFYRFMPGRRGGPSASEPSSETGFGSPAARALPAPSFPVPQRRGEQRALLMEGTRDTAAQGSSGGGSAWGQDWRNFTFVKIIWALQGLLVDKPARFFINPSSLLEALRRDGIGISEEEIFFWVNQSVDRGILTRDVKESSTPGGQRFYRYYLNRYDRLVTLADEIPRALLYTVHDVLQKRPDWNGIAFNFLLKLLQVHPVLSNPGFDVQPHRIREWINFLIDEQMLIKIEEPDLKEPTRTTTMVSANYEHPQTRWFLNDMPRSPFFAPEHQALLRTVLTIDHFLHWLRTKSPEENWLPLMTLKSWQRNVLGDQLTKWAIAECEREAIFTIDRFQNKSGTDPTVAGVRLDYTHPLVTRVLSRRDEFLRILISLLRNRAAVAYGVLEQRLREQESFGETVEERIGWLPIMLDTKIITIERESTGLDETRQVLLCRLNSREKFVGELLTRIIREGQGRGASAPEAERASGGLMDAEPDTWAGGGGPSIPVSRPALEPPSSDQPSATETGVAPGLPTKPPRE